MIRALCDRRYVCTDEWYEVADCADSRPHVNAQTEYGNKKGTLKISALEDKHITKILRQ